MIRTVIADDQEMVRMGFAMILDAAPDISVVGQCGDGRQALALVADLRPDVALLDIRMPVLDGLEVTRRITSGTRAVIVTTFGDDEVVDAALAAGACGFLLKDSGAGLLVAAVRAAAGGDALISPELTIPLLERRAPSDTIAGARVAELSPREAEVARLVARGRTNAEIADALVVSLGTVKTHLNNISGRLGARNRVEIAAAMWEAGLMRAEVGT